MKKNKKDLLQQLNPPWITKEGYLDLTKFPIDSILKQSLSKDLKEFRSSCITLSSMSSRNRLEAQIYLIGLFEYFSENLDKLTIIVENLSLADTKNKKYAELLFRELKRIKSSNSTRKYLNAILKKLSDFPLEIIEDGFNELINNDTFSYRMKNKFKEILYYKTYSEF